MLSSTVPALGHDKAPVGYLLLCLKSPADCAEGGASSVLASEELLGILDTVNRRINRTIVPRNDPDADVWDGSVTRGDCEDFAISKRRALVRAGLPPSALKITVVTTKSGKGHVLLTVVTSIGELALDNLTDEILPLRQTGYKVIFRSGD